MYNLDFKFNPDAVHAPETIGVTLERATGLDVHVTEVMRRVKMVESDPEAILRQYDAMKTLIEKAQTPAELFWIAFSYGIDFGGWQADMRRDALSRMRQQFAALAGQKRPTSGNSTN